MPATSSPTGTASAEESLMRVSHARQPGAVLNHPDLGAVQRGHRAEFFLGEPGAAASHEQVAAEALSGGPIDLPAVHQAS
jgi:hypothetical protein